MDIRTIPPTYPTDRLSYLWLVVAAALLPFSGGSWSIPLAAWLAPMFLLRFVRTQRPLPGFLFSWLVRYAIAIFALRMFILVPGAAYYLLVAVLILATNLPYLLDRLLAPRLPGLLTTLVFPTTYTSLEYLGSFGFSGAFASLANTQYGNLALMQLVSVTGVWGITFLVTWFASVANWAWECGFEVLHIRRGFSLYAGILAAVLLLGGARLALFPPRASVVRVAGLSASQALSTTVEKELPMETLDALMSGKASPDERQQVRAAYAPVFDDLFARSQQEAQAGAKIVVWPEPSAGGASLLAEDEAGLIRHAAGLAKQEGIYLDMGLAVFPPSTGQMGGLKDETVMVDPSGGVTWTYEKTHLVIGSEQGMVVPGNGKVPLVDSHYGRLANVICFDMDYPATIRQAGRAGVDLMLVPSNDWQAIDPVHTQAAVFRAIEDGFSLVRQTSHGLAMAVDYEGRVLAASDYFTAPQQVMVAYLPVHGVRTIYAAIGDLFAWLCLLGFLTLTAAALLPLRKRPPSP